MDTMPLCPVCQKPLPPNAPKGLCPECVMKGGFPTATGTEPPKDKPRFVPPTLAEVAAQFPQLEILEFIGQGGMGAVYKARQPALDRLVALKVLPPEIEDPGFAERFTREARALAKLNHPNIIAVYEFGQAGTFHYFLMEFVDGVNLRQLQATGQLTPSQALKIVPQICEALQFAHDEGVVHRDIKPENVLVDKRGRVKIADFGIAKILGQGGATMLTGAKDVVGTPHYMAPEQVETPQDVDHRADIYSLGVVFYEMLTGELPLGKFQPPSNKVQVDVRLDDVVLHALEKEPARRYQQASQVKTAVENIASHPEAPPRLASDASAPPPIQQSAPPPTGEFSDRFILPAFLLVLFFGVFGAHRFYVGKYGTAVVQLLTFGGCGIWWFIDVILLVCKAFFDGNGRRMTEWVDHGLSSSKSNAANIPRTSPPPPHTGSPANRAAVPVVIAVVILAIVGLFFGCGGIPLLMSGCTSATVIGSGESATETRTISDFSKIQLTGSPDVHVTIGPSNSVVVTTDNNLLSIIRTDVSGDTLKVGSKESYNTRLGVNVRVTVPSLNAVSITGSGNVKVDHLNSDELSLAITGSGTGTVNGRANKLKVHITGSGNAKAAELLNADATVRIIGSGNASVYATNSLNVSISGSGNVRCLGHPAQISQNVTGSGSVKTE